MTFAGLEIAELVGLFALMGTLAYVLAGQIGVRVSRGAQEAEARVIEALEARVTLLESERLDLKSQVAELKLNLERIRGEADGRRQALEDIIEAVASADVCTEAPGCPNRRLPGAERASAAVPR